MEVAWGLLQEKRVVSHGPFWNPPGGERRGGKRTKVGGGWEHFLEVASVLPAH